MSFGLDLENRVHSVASTVIDGFFPYLPQMITSIKIPPGEGGILDYGSAEGPPRVVENRNLLSHPDDLGKEAYLIRMT